MISIGLLEWNKDNRTGKEGYIRLSITIGKGPISISTDLSTEEAGTLADLLKDACFSVKEDAGNMAEVSISLEEDD